MLENDLASPLTDQLAEAKKDIYTSSFLSNGGYVLFVICEFNSVCLSAASSFLIEERLSIQVC